MGDVTDAKRAQIEDIVKRKTNISAENIIITPIDTTSQTESNTQTEGGAQTENSTQTGSAAQTESETQTEGTEASEK